MTIGLSLVRKNALFTLYTQFYGMRLRVKSESFTEPACSLRIINFFSRLFFLASFVVVCCLSIFFISNVYQKWSASPIIIGLNAISTSISDIPFPAITICNMNQAKKSIVGNIKPYTTEYALLQSLCQQDDEEYNLTNIPKDFVGKWALFRNFLVNVI